MLRTAVLIVAALIAAAGVTLILIGGAAWPAGVQLTVLGLLFVAAVLFERWRYTKNFVKKGGQWQPTGERFTDPTTGVLTEVYYNAQTGQRDYREVR